MEGMYCLVYEVLGNRDLIVALDQGGIGPLELIEPMEGEVHSELLGCNIFFPQMVELKGELHWDSIKKKFIGGIIRSGKKISQ